MATASSLLYRHGPRIVVLLALGAILWSGLVLLASGAVASSGPSLPMPERPLVGPFRWGGGPDAGIA